MASKLNFRARNLDASKPMSVYFAEDLPELTDLNAINRSVPAMPSGMEKEEEAEKHLQDILELQEKPEKVKDKKVIELVIPTPEVFSSDTEGYQTLYINKFKVPRAYIHVQPFSADHDQPDYDMDEEDEEFLANVLRKEKKLEVSELTFEDMLDKLEKNSGHSVVSAKEAKLLLKEDDELILAVYDYWVDKRLRLKQPLIPLVKSDKRDTGVIGPSGGPPGTTASGNNASTASNNPYIAFRRRTEKMQTRKNRKNDESSYANMLKLRRDLQRAVCLLEMIKRREKLKKEGLNLTMDILEKRHLGNDWDGAMFNEAMKSVSKQLPQISVGQHRVLQPATYVKYSDNLQFDGMPRKRPYVKKKKVKGVKTHRANGADYNAHLLAVSSDDERMNLQSINDFEEDDIEGPFEFKRKKNCQYLAPLMGDHGEAIHQGMPWEDPEDGGGGEARYRYSLASLSTPKPRFLGHVRRRMGRGGRTILDRAYANNDDLWRSLDFTITCGQGRGLEIHPPSFSENEMEVDEENPFADSPHYRPVTPPHCREEPEWDPYKNRLPEVPIGLPNQPVRPSLQRSKSTVSVTGINGSVAPSSSQAATAAAVAAVLAKQQQQLQQSPMTMRTVSVDSVIASNAASAVINQGTLDLFTGIRQQQQMTTN